MKPMNLSPNTPTAIRMTRENNKEHEMSTTEKIRNGEIEARHIEVGDAITYEGAHYMVRDGIPVDADLSAVRLRLSAGRTDQGFWITFRGDEIISVYRDSGIPDYAFSRKDA